MVSSKPLPTNSNKGMAHNNHDTFLPFLSLLLGRVVNHTASKARATPAIFNTVASSLYRYMENTNGITIDSLYATVAAATPIFCMVNAARLNMEIKQAPMINAQPNQGCFTSVLFMGKLPFTMLPVITQTM